MSLISSRFAGVLILIAAFACATAIVAPLRTHAQTAVTCEEKAAERIAEYKQWIAAYYDSEAKWGDFIKKVARANHAPSDFIWDHIPPGIAQGPNIPDSLDGQFILRVDLYYAHYQAELVREACRALNCRTYSLPVGYESAQPALEAYVQAVEAMPTFSGPGGMNTPGPKRMMSMHDAAALEKMLQEGFCEDENRTNSTDNRDGATLITAITDAQQCVAPTVPLARGARGTNVTRLQKYLVSQGYMGSENATGLFGKITEAAVQRMQRDRGIVSGGNAQSTGWGRVGTRTLGAIRAQCGGTATETNTPPQPPVLTRTDGSTENTPANQYDSWMNDTLNSISGNTTVDICSNIPSVQIYVPFGYHTQGSQCIQDTTAPGTGESCMVQPTGNASLAAQHPDCYYYIANGPDNSTNGGDVMNEDGEPVHPGSQSGSTSQTGSLGVGTPVSGIPSTVTYYIWASGQGGALKIEFGDGQSATAPACYAPSDVCYTPGTLTHVYTAAGPYTATLKTAAGITIGTASLTISAQQPSNPLNNYVAGAIPSLAQFMKAANTTNSKRASSLLYGVIGASRDIRDWTAIMSANDPLKAACEATNAMYNSGNSAAYMPAGAKRVADFDPTKITVLAQTTNFVFYKEEIPGAGVHYGLHLTDSNGYLLTAPANSDILVQHLSNYCFDKSQLTSLQAQLNALGFNQAAETSWPQGFIGSGYSPQDPTITGATLSSTASTYAQVASALAAVRHALDAIKSALQ